MSRSFSSASDYLDAATAVIATRPCTISLWAKNGDLGGASGEHYFNIGVSGSSDNRITLFCGNGTGLVAAGERDASASQAAIALTTYAVGGWFNLTGVFTSDSSRACFVNGAAKATNSGVASPSAFNATRVSGNLVSTPGNPILSGGLVAYIGVWNIALADADVLKLYTQTPDLVQSANLIEYWPLIGNQSPEPSSGTQGTSLTVTGTTFSTDNPFSFAGVGWL